MGSTWGRLLRRFTVPFAAYGRTTRYTKKISTRNNPLRANWASYRSRRRNSRVSTTKAKQSLSSPISMVWGNDAWSPWNRGSQHGHRLPRKTEFSEPEVFTRNPASIHSKGPSLNKPKIRSWGINQTGLGWRCGTDPERRESGSATSHTAQQI